MCTSSIATAALRTHSSAGRPEAVHSGYFDIPLSGQGHSPSYAVWLDSGQSDAWLVVAGLTGQVTTGYDSNDIDILFTTLATGRPDAD